MMTRAVRNYQSEIYQNRFPLHAFVEGDIVKEICMYANGIQIYVTGFSDEYPTTPIENERVESESRPSYSLPVRLMYWAPDEFVEPEIYPDSIIQTPGDGLNWQQILVDVESNKAELEWSLVNVYIEAQNNYDFYFDYQGHYDDDDDDIIEDIPLEDFDFRGPPPAARSAVYNLERETIGESRDFLCCICQAILLGGEKCVKCLVVMNTMKDVFCNGWQLQTLARPASMNCSQMTQIMKHKN
ncbi:hypothetical protein SUGI_0465280 [Cryptomeria japonica]|nr:hypothetical protein SUGI_0465280 [Cryptomeria japonica]